MKKIIVAIALLISVAGVKAQILKPVKWSYGAKKTSATEAMVFIKATIQPGWHIYSQFVKEGGPIPTSFKFSPVKGVSYLGKTIEPKPLTKFEETFGMNVSFFEGSVVFQQKVKLAAKTAVVKGTLEFMVCNDKQCLPPEEVPFTVTIK